MFFKWRVVAVWAFFSIYQSLVLFHFTVSGSYNGHNSSGKVFGLWDVSTMAFNCIVVTVNLRLLMASNSITRWHSISVAGSILAWFAFIFVYSGIITPYDRQVSLLEHVLAFCSFHQGHLCSVFIDVFLQENIFFVIYVLMSTFYFYLTLLLVPVVALLGDFIYLG